MDVKKSSIFLLCLFWGNVVASTIQQNSDLQNQIKKQGIRIDTIKEEIGSFTGSMEEKAEEITGLKGELNQLKSTVGELEETFALIKDTVDKIFSISEFQLRFLSKTLTSCEDLKGYGISESGRYFINGGIEIETQNPPIEVQCEFHSDGTVVTILKNNNISVTDCYDVKENGFNLPGIYELEIDSSTKVKAFCDVQGYTVIQSRGQFGNPKDYFSGNWNKYKMGFGVPGKEHWIGLDTIHKLTTRQGKTMKLKISMERFSGEEATEYYDSFNIKDETGLYKLNVSGYHGNGGDGLTRGHILNGMSFSTPDKDNDKWGSNCASDPGQGAGSGWWFKACRNVNPNGLNYGHAKTTSVAMVWYYWGNKYESLKTITMAIRRADIPGDN